MLLDHLLREKADDLGVDLVLGQVHDGQIELAAQEGEEFLFLYVPGLHENGADPLPGLLLGLQRGP